MFPAGLVRSGLWQESYRKRDTEHDVNHQWLFLENDKNQYLYEPLDGNAPVKSQGHKPSERRRFPEVPSDRTNEVQDEP